MIASGSEICGLISSGAKRKLREVASVYSIRDEPTRGEHPVTFIKEKARQVHTSYHDAPVIKISIANLILKRVLVDNSSSANVLYLEMFKNMKLDERIM